MLFVFQYPVALLRVPQQDITRDIGRPVIIFLSCWYNNHVNGRVAAISAAWYDSGKRRDESGRIACWVSAELPSM